MSPIWAKKCQIINLKIPNTIFWLGQNKSFPCDGTRVNEIPINVMLINLEKCIETR
jgi:hypothetical protein